MSLHYRPGRDNQPPVVPVDAARAPGAKRRFKNGFGVASFVTAGVGVVTSLVWWSLVWGSILGGLWALLVLLLNAGVYVAAIVLGVISTSLARDQQAHGQPRVSQAGPRAALNAAGNPGLTIGIAGLTTLVVVSVVVVIGVLLLLAFLVSVLSHVNIYG